MDPSNWIWVVSLFLRVLLWSFPCCGRLEYLYYTPPGGSCVSRKAGLYERATDSDPTVGSIYAYDCLNSDDDGTFDIQYLSYDPVSQFVLMQLRSHIGLTMYQGPLCGLCRNSSLEIVFDDAMLSHKIGPVAIYDSTIYFVWQRRRRTGVSTRRTTLELRTFSDTCRRHFPVTASSVFYVNRCSKLVGVLAEETFERRATIYTTSSLTVATVDGGLIFFTQLRIVGFTANGMLGSNHMVLVQMSRDGQKRFLHSERTSTTYLQVVPSSGPGGTHDNTAVALINTTDREPCLYVLHHTGAVAFRDRRLCWSALDRLLCADWTPDGLVNVRTVLKPGQTAGICTAPVGDRIMANITTGVAIARRDANELTLYFGCISQVAGSGGAGILRMSGYDTSSRPVALRTKSKRILAGSMFITDACAQEKEKIEEKEEKEEKAMKEEPVVEEKREMVERQGQPIKTVTMANSAAAQRDVVSDSLLLILVIFHIWKHATKLLVR